jgi:hypothetical protein
MSKKLALAKRSGARSGGRRIKRWEEKFFKALSKVPSVKHACLSAGIARRTAYDRRERDAEFARQWQDVIDSSIDDVEARVFKLALNGNDQVAANLCTWLLRCHRPVPYDPVNRTELAVAGGIVFIPQKRDGTE